MEIVEFNVVLFILTFALIWKIVYMSLNIANGVNLNILSDIFEIFGAMIFLVAFYHKAIKFTR